MSDEAVSNLIRLAFACEVSKRPLRREDIVSLVLGEKNGRSFRPLLSSTNARLAQTFGMQLVPLPAMARSLDTHTVAGRRAATQTRRQESHSSQGPASAAAFALQTTAMVRPRLRLHRQPDRLGLLAVILCLCHLSESGMVEEGILYDKLAVLGHEAHFGSLMDGLAMLKRQRYVMLSKKPDDANVNYYSAGPRAAVEFPPAALAKFIVDVGAAAGISSDHLTLRVNNALGLARSD